MSNSIDCNLKSGQTKGKFNAKVQRSQDAMVKISAPSGLCDFALNWTVAAGKALGGMA
jgi:hypothetical protein